MLSEQKQSAMQGGVAPVRMNQIWNCCTVQYDMVTWGIDFLIPKERTREQQKRHGGGGTNWPIHFLRDDTHYTTSCSERQTVVHAELSQQSSNGEPVFMFSNGAPPAYFIVDASTELSPDRAHSFKHGDKRYLVDHGVRRGSARIVAKQGKRALLQMLHGTQFDILYPDGIVSRFKLEKGILYKHSLSPLEMIEVRLLHARERLQNGSPQCKIALYNGLLKLLQLQTERVCIATMLDFFHNETFSAKTARSIKSTLKALKTRSGVGFKEHAFRVLKKENNRACRTDRRRTDSRSSHGTLTAFRT